MYEIKNYPYITRITLFCICHKVSYFAVVYFLYNSSRHKPERKTHSRIHIPCCHYAEHGFDAFVVSTEFAPSLLAASTPDYRIVASEVQYNIRHIIDYVLVPYGVKP